MHRDRSALFNLSASALAEAGIKAAQFATVILIARALGPEGFGIVGAAWALYQLAIPVVQGAPELLGIRDLSADRANGARTVGDIASLKLGLALAAIAALSIYGLLFYGSGSAGLMQTTVQGCVLLVAAAVPGWAARALQRSDLHAGPRLAQAWLFVVLTALGLAISPSPLTVPVAEAVAWVVAAVAGFRLVRPLLPGLSADMFIGALLDFGRMRRVLGGIGGETFRLAAAGMATAAIWWLPVPISGHLFGIAAGGHMAAAVRLVLIAMAALHIGFQVFLPILAKHHAGDREKFRHLAASLAFYSTLAHFAVAAVLVIGAAPLAGLVFGRDFEPAVPLVRILAMGLVPLGLSSAYGYSLIAAGRSTVFFRLSIFGGATTIAGQLAGMIATGRPDGILFGLPFLFLLCVVFAVRAHDAGLIDSRIFSLSRLAPANIMRFLKER